MRAFLWSSVSVNLSQTVQPYIICLYLPLSMCSFGRRLILTCRTSSCEVQNSYDWDNIVGVAGSVTIVLSLPGFSVLC
jgi:hypothetical protein